MINFLFRKLVFITLLVGLLAGCGGAASTPLPATSSPTGPEPHNTQPSLQTPTPPATQLVATPTEILQTSEPVSDSSNLPSGWTTYSNPDFIRGIAVLKGQLWAATLGGVVFWDLEERSSKLFTTWDGLVEIQGNDIVYCPVPEEQILVAHEEGVLSAYNLTLKKWSRLPISFEDGSTMHGIRALFCDPDNQRLLAGSATELGILDMETGRWKRFGEKEGLKIENLRTIDVAGQSIWIAGEKQGAFLISGSNVFSFNEASGFPSGPVNDMAIATDSSVWFGYPTGLIHYLDRKWNPYGAQSSTGIPFRSVDQVEISPDKRIWIAAKNEGVCPFDPVKLLCSTVYPSPDGYSITELVIGEDDTAYAGTDGRGIMMLLPDQVVRLAFDQETLTSNDIRDIAESQDGLLWVATARGINQIDPTQPQAPWGVLPPDQKQVSRYQVHGLLPAQQGMWIFYEQEARASFYDGKDWLELDTYKGLNSPVQVSAVDWLGRIWLGTDQGILLWSDSMLRSYTPPDEAGGAVYQAFVADETGIWVGTNRALLRYERYQWRTILPDLSVQAIAKDGQGNLLLGTERGLVRLIDNQSYLWLIHLENELLIEPSVTSLTLDGESHLWVGTAQHGLLFFDGKKWEQFDTSVGFPSNHIRKVYRDRLGTIWIAANTEQGGGALVRFVPPGVR